MQERLAFPTTISYGNWPYSIWPFLVSNAASDHTHPSGISPTASEISRNRSLSLAALDSNVLHHIYLVTHLASHLVFRVWIFWNPIEFPRLVNVCIFTLRIAERYLPPWGYPIYQHRYLCALDTTTLTCWYSFYFKKNCVRSIVFSTHPIPNVAY